MSKPRSYWATSVEDQFATQNCKKWANLYLQCHWIYFFPVHMNKDVGPLSINQVKTHLPLDWNHLDVVAILAS